MKFDQVLSDLAHLARLKEYLTVARTPQELREQEPRMRDAGFRKRRNANGQSASTGEFFQWWDRKDTRRNNAQPSIGWQRRQREAGRCIVCGKSAATSKRGGFSQYCDAHRAWYRDYMRRYMRSRNAATRA